MNKFIALLKFEFMSNSPRHKGERFFSRLRRFAVALLGVGLVCAVFLYAINVIMNVFVSAGMQHEFVTIFTFFMMILHLVVGAVSATKNLFIKADLSILKLPVDGIDVFKAKFVFLYFKQLLYSFVITLPTFIMFGLKTARGIGYYLMLVPSALFLPIIPLLLAILLAVPIMWLIQTFKNKFLVLLAFYVVGIVAAFTAYIYALKFILSILESGDFANVFDKSTVFAIKQFSAHLYLPILLKNVLLFYNFWKSALVNFALAVILGICVYFFAKKFYFKLLLSSKNQHAFFKRTKEVHQSLTFALMSKEFKNIFRSTNYAFQYLTIVITTPLMVYFSSQVASNVGTSMLGSSVLPGIVVLVLIMFLSMGTSFSATSITREGGNFFLTKIIPVSFTKQIFIKFIIYIIISIPAIFISCFVLSIAQFVTFSQAGIIAVALSFVIVGNICNSILMDIKKPQFQHMENGEISSGNRNVSASIGIGFIISFLMGIGGIVLSVFVSVPAMYLVLFGFGIPFACIEAFRLFHNVEKRYNRIEV